MSITIKTNLGDLKAELYCQQTPKTCKDNQLKFGRCDTEMQEARVQQMCEFFGNFLALCASGYYDGTIFHRNIKGFAIQGGDPSGSGKGGESIYGGFFKDEFVSTLRHDRRGILSMANQGKPNTNGSQFFITYSRQPHLNGVYTVFGRLIDGLDTLDKMEREPVGRKHRPENNIVIEKIIIHANPIAEAEQL